MKKTITIFSLILVLFNLSCTSKKSEYNYIISNVDNSEAKFRNKFKIEAIYDTDVYLKEDIENICNEIFNKVKDTISSSNDMKVFINLFSSEKIKNLDGSQYLALCKYIDKTDENLNITYNEGKINALNDSNNENYLKFKKLLEDNNTDLYKLNEELHEMKFVEVISEMKKEYGKDYNSNLDLFDVEVNKIIEKKRLIFDKYNIPDSLEMYIYVYLDYCK